VGSPKPRRTAAVASEDEVLEIIRDTVGNGIGGLGLRDDAAVVDVPGGGPVVVSVDSVVEGVHVDLSVCTPADVGWKALMRALSDLAAMGAAPLGALVALCVPGGSGDGEMAVGVMSGVAEASAATGCPVVGGDLSTAGDLVAAVTVLGTLDEGGRAVSRAGARPGDVVLVTGPCGLSAAGLRELRARAGPDGPAPDAGLAYRRPVARLREGERARRAGVHAMIDLSDGLALDLHRLADASGVGFVLEDVPVADGATTEEALGGGEDYELLLVAAPATAPVLRADFEEAGLRAPRSIGVIGADSSVRLLRGEPLARLGWQHRVG
jgi:thiamine-monophosphate kinase